MAKSSSIPTTRRSLMAGGTAAAVVPIAVIGSAAAGDDAELLELGRRWEAIYREVCAFRPTADAIERVRGR